MQMKLKFELSILDVEFQNNKIKSDTKEKKTNTASERNCFQTKETKSKDQFSLETGGYEPASWLFKETGSHIQVIFTTFHHVW